MECSICGISDKMRGVSRALSSKGIVFVCENCAKNERLILLKKPIIEKESHESVYERMARLAGVVPKPQPERLWLKPQDKSLKQIVDKNYEKKMASQKFELKPRQDLVENFHWIIMRVRRVQGLTQEQLAKRINEPEAAVKMAEQGVVPQGYNLIDKLERFLKIRLVRQRDLSLPLQKQQQHLTEQLQKPQNIQQKLSQQTQRKESTSINGKVLTFDKSSTDFITIADLKKMREEKERTRLGETEETAEKELDKKEEHESSRPYDRLDYE